MVDLKSRASEAPALGTQDGHVASPAADDVRRYIPVLGLKNYWYPAIEDRKVGSKPVGLKMLGEQLVFFRGKDGEGKALHNVCAHRGGSLMHGDCHYPGTVSCPYHGWTYDGEGNVLAVLPEGPDSQVPGKVKQRAYQTRTLRGLVFVWMGDGDPAPIEEDVPPEFFRNDGVMLFAEEIWPVNWRVAIENVSDAHVPYVHRDSMLVLLSPMGPVGPTGARSRIVNNRAIVSGRALSAATDHRTDRAGRPTPWRNYFPALGAYWPKHGRRWLWAWATKNAGKRRYQRQPIETTEEWAGTLRHLPAIIRLDYRTHVYTRNNIPIDENHTREIYVHYTPVSSTLGRIYERIHFKLFHRWAMYTNFSKQDFKAVKPQRFDTPEYLSATDSPNVNWRRLVMRARGMQAVAAEAGVDTTSPVDE